MNVYDAEKPLLNYALSGFLILFLATSGTVSRAAELPESTLDRHLVVQHDIAYITDIGTLLYRDTDRDGYFAGLSLTIDADTPHHDERVYASIDLVTPDQRTERLHTSGHFTLYGTSLSDEYRIDIDLVRNYPTANYDLQISLHGARDDRLLDRVGAVHFSNLRQLPLESEDLDLQFDNPDSHTSPDSHVPVSNNDIRVSEYGGSAGLTLLMFMLSTVIARPRRHWRHTERS